MLDFVYAGTYHIHMYDINIQLVHGLRIRGPIIILVTLVGTFFAFQANSFPVLRGRTVIFGRSTAAEVDSSSLPVKWEEVKRREVVKKGKSEFRQLLTLVLRCILPNEEALK